MVEKNFAVLQYGNVYYSSYCSAACVGLSLTISLWVLKDYYMRLINNIGFILLAVYLILVAITALIPGIAIPSVIFGVVALAAAIFILIGR